MRSGLVKIGVLVVALVVAMGMMGSGYSLWFDELFLDGITNMGTTQSIIWEGDCEPDSGGTYIECSAVSGDPYTVPHVLTTNVTNPQDLNIGSFDYVCTFYIQNTGTIPIKIQSIEVPSPTAEVVVTAAMSEDFQLDVGETEMGSVWVEIIGTYPSGDPDPLVFDVIINVLRFNE